MVKIDFSDYELTQLDDVLTLKNVNTTIGFVRFNDSSEIEYIFVNLIFRKKGLAKKLLRLVKEKIQKNLVFQDPVSHLGSKLLKSLSKYPDSFQ